MARRLTADKLTLEYSQDTTYRRIAAEKLTAEYEQTITYRRLSSVKLMVEYETAVTGNRRVTSEKAILEYERTPTPMIKPYKELLVSVADVYGYNSSGDIVLVGKTFLDTGLEFSSGAYDVNSGRGGALEYVYFSEPEASITIEDVQFNLTMLSLTTGNDYTTGNNIYDEETLCVGEGGLCEVSETPVTGSYAWIVLPNGSYEKATFSGKEFTTTANEGEKISVTYITLSSSAKVVEVVGEIDPMEIYLVLETQLAIGGDRTVTENGKIQIEIPRAIISGDFGLIMTSEGVSSTAISARALALDEYSSDGYNSVYGYIKEIVPDRKWYENISSIVISNGDFSLVSGDTQELVVRAIPLNGPAFIVPYSDIDFSADNGVCASVNTSGIVTAISPGGSAIRAKVKNRWEMSDYVVVTTT